MVGGNSRALYEGPFGQQAQVWRITETFVWPKKSRPTVDITTTEITSEDDTDMDDQESDASNQAKDKGKGREKAPSPTVPLHGPATNAGFPMDLPPSTRAGLSTPSAEQITLNETIKQQVEAIDGYEVVPPTELDGAIERDEPGLELILTGTGHSAWGRFILKGRVRLWDGMATLVKEYAVSAGAARSEHREYTIEDHGADYLYSQIRGENGFIEATLRPGMSWSVAGEIRSLQKSL
jgi:hypothetical protein